MSTSTAPRILALLALLGAAACGGGAPTPETPAGEPPADAAAPGDMAGDAAPPAGDAPGEPPPSDAPAAGAPASSGAPAASGDPAGAPAGEPAPKPSAMDLGGTLSPAQVAKFVEDHHTYFDPCIQIAEKGGKVYKVSITTRVWVGPRGKVNKTEVVKTTSKDDAFGKCVTGAFEKIAFGKPKDGATATLTFPMTFSGEQQ